MTSHPLRIGAGPEGRLFAECPDVRLQVPYIGREPLSVRVMPAGTLVRLALSRKFIVLLGKGRALSDALALFSGVGHRVGRYN